MWPYIGVLHWWDGIGTAVVDGFDSSSFDVSAFDESAFFIMPSSIGASNYRSHYFNAGFTQANYFTPTDAVPPTTITGPIMRGLIPGRLPGFNSGFIF